MSGFQIASSPTNVASLAANTFTGQQIISLNGAASTPPLTLTGTWFSGGSATTTKPQLLVEPSGTTSTNWTASGTGIGVNAASGFTGNLIDLQLAASSIFKVSSNSGSASLSSDSGVMIFNRSGNPWAIGSNLSTIGLTLTGTCPLAWANGDATNGPDTFMVRDAANVVAMKNATTAQTFRVYGNTTGSHYLNVTHNGTNAVLSVNGGGTLHISSLPTANPGAGILWNNSGSPAIGT